MSYKTIISAKNLIENINNPNYRLFDCRCDIKDTSYGLEAYNEGHIPGAIFVDIDNDLASEKTPTSGRHPLPNIEVIVNKLSKWGVSGDTQAVIYDDAGGAFASRMWWIMRWLGHDNVAVLDGGIGSFISMGHKLTSDHSQIVPSNFVPSASDEMHVDVEEVENVQYQLDRILIDARSKERYLGIKDPVDNIYGHVPGAISSPLGLNLDKNGFFRSSEELKLHFSKLLGEIKPENVISMCGSGITACHNLLAMEIAGFKGAKLYVGSWSEWITNPSRPIAKSD